MNTRGCRRETGARQPWLRHLFRCGRTRPSAKNRLCLEVLEGRCLPSTVTNLSDHDPGSLRDAIATTPEGGTVEFQPGLSGTIVLTSGELAIRKDLAIAGPGAEAVTVSGNHASRVFSIATVTAAISDLTIADGSTSKGGAGIYNELGTLTVTGCAFSGNSAGSGGGIALYGGTLTVIGCAFGGNSANGESGVAGLDGGVGGGIYSEGTLSVTGSIFSSNSSNWFGGGIYNHEYHTLAVTACTFRGNSSNRFGSGISNEGTLTVVDSSFSGNSSVFGGSGIYNEGTLTVSVSSFSGNSGHYGGGGIFNLNTLTVTACTFSGNFGVDMGGGIENAELDSLLVVTACTFSGNSANSGGGIYNLGRLTVTAATFSGNSADSGGGIENFATLTMWNSLLAMNRSGDVVGSLGSQGHNLIGDGSGGSGYTATDLVGTSASPIDPELGPLQDNGGPTPTMALLSGSPALDAGAPTDSEWDQRGPGYARLANGATDIGAYEVQQPGTGAGARPGVLRERTILVPKTTYQPGAPVWPPGVPSAPRVPVRPAVAAVDQVLASWSSASAYGHGGRSQHASPAEVGSWPVDLVLAGESL